MGVKADRGWGWSCREQKSFDESYLRPNLVSSAKDLMMERYHPEWVWVDHQHRLQWMSKTCGMNCCPFDRRIRGHLVGSFRFLQVTRLGIPHHKVADVVTDRCWSGVGSAFVHANHRVGRRNISYFLEANQVSNDWNSNNNYYRIRAP